MLRDAGIDHRDDTSSAAGLQVPGGWRIRRRRRDRTAPIAVHMRSRSARAARCARRTGSAYCTAAIGLQLRGHACASWSSRDRGGSFSTQTLPICAVDVKRAIRRARSSAAAASPSRGRGVAGEPHHQLVAELGAAALAASDLRLAIALGAEIGSAQSTLRSSRRRRTMLRCRRRSSGWASVELERRRCASSPASVQRHAGQRSAAGRVAPSASCARRGRVRMQHHADARDRLGLRRRSRAQQNRQQDKPLQQSSNISRSQSERPRHRRARSRWRSYTMTMELSCRLRCQIRPLTVWRGNNDACPAGGDRAGRKLRLSAPAAH